MKQCYTCIWIVLAVMLYGASPKKPFIEHVQVVFPETQSYITYNLNHECGAKNDRACCFTIQCKNIHNSPPYVQGIDYMLINQSGDTLKTGEGMCKWKSFDAWGPTKGTYTLYVIPKNKVYKPLIKKIEIDVPPGTGQEVEVHLGNYPVVYTYEVRSWKKLQKKEIETLRNTLAKEVEGSDSTLFSSTPRMKQPQFQFYSAKKCSLSILDSKR